MNPVQAFKTQLQAFISLTPDDAYRHQASLSFRLHFPNDALSVKI